MKTILCAVVVLLACVTLSQSLTQTWGHRFPDDSLIYARNVTVTPKAGRYPSQTIQYPPKGYYTGKYITAIQVKDNEKKRSLFMSVLKRGGPYQKVASIELLGLYGKGFNATVMIYGL
ncbi:uncharacterized protein [Musca autumnalis]|uniref:uncharacterized protein n=1 Tax=Musca autumnalis TaxID=221902 RepID=UPI003CE886FA